MRRRSTELYEECAVLRNLRIFRQIIGIALAIVAGVAAAPQAIALQEPAEAEPASEQQPAEEEPAGPEPDGEMPAAEGDQTAPDGEMPAGEGEPAAEGDSPAMDDPVPEPVEVPEEAENANAPAELPENYKPPGAPLKETLIDKPLLTDEEESTLLTELRTARYKDVLRDGNLDSAAGELLKKVARYDVHRLSLKKHQRQLHKMRDELFKDVRSAGSLQNNLQQREAFRAAFFQEIVDRATELLDGNFYVRLNAALILSHLDIREFDPQTDEPATPFSPAVVPLIKIINSDDQHQAIKIIALSGIQRIASAGTMSQTDRLDVADRMIAELKNPKYDWWYQMRLAETLGRIDLPVDRENRPFIVQILTEVVADRGRSWIVRSAAAKALGRCKIAGNVNLDKVIFEIVQFSRDMTEAYNREPNAVYWKQCYFWLYLAFRPQDSRERDAKFGFLQNAGQYKATIQSAYQAVLPIVRQVVASGSTPEALPDSELARLDDWLKQHIPTNQSIAPNMPVIQNTQAREPERPAR